MNAEHYPDITADTAIRNMMPQSGEVWEDVRGWRYVILKNQGNFCNVLTMVLSDKPVHKIGEYSVIPARITFLKEDCYGKFIRNLTEFEWDTLLAEINSKMNIEITVSKVEGVDETNEILCKKLNEQREKNAKLSEQLNGNNDYWHKLCINMRDAYLALLNKLVEV